MFSYLLEVVIFGDSMGGCVSHKMDLEFLDLLPRMAYVSTSAIMSSVPIHVRITDPFSTCS